MVDALLQLLSGLPDWLVIACLTVIPVVEMQASFPVALGVFKMSVWQAYIIVVTANMIPALIVFYGWDTVIRQSQRHWPWFHGFMSRYHDRLHTRWQEKIDRYGPIAVFLFVAVPGPFSGVWSGSMLAWIFGLHRKPAMLAIFLGVLVAAAFIVLITTGVIHVV